MAYADIETSESSMASTIASSFQQISMSFGLACGSLVAAWYLGDLPQSDRLAVITALHRAFVTLGGLTIVSSLSFWTPPRQGWRERQPCDTRSGMTPPATNSSVTCSLIRSEWFCPYCILDPTGV
jgi:hypothetical protein